MRLCQVYANGYAQAKLHGNALLPLYVASMGRLSEFAGEAVGGATDLQVWGLELPVIYRSLFAKLTEQELTLVRSKHHESVYGVYISSRQYSSCLV